MSLTKHPTKSKSLCRLPVKNVRYDATTINEPLSLEETQNLLHELKVHQVELEKQNEELRRTQRINSESRQLFMHIIDFLPEATFAVDNDKKVIAWNRAMEVLSGMGKGEMLGRHEYAYSIHLLNERRKCLLDLLDAGLEEHGTNFGYVRRNGENLNAELFSSSFYGGKGGYILTTAAPLYDDDGRRLGAIESIRDITAIKKAKNDLHKKSIELDMFFNNSLDLLCVADTMGFFWRLNPEWEGVLGYDLGEMERGNFIDYVHPDDIQAAREALVALNEQLKVLALVLRFRCKAGDYRNIEFHCYPMGKFVYMTARDISERLRHEQDLQEAMRVADAANRAKGEFL